MSLQKIITYSTILTISFTMSLIVDARGNKASAQISDRCLQAVHEANMAIYKANMAMNRSQGRGSTIGVYSFPELTSTKDEKNTWVNAPDGDVIGFPAIHNESSSYIDLQKTSTKIINSCKKTVAVNFFFQSGEVQVTYGIVKGRVVQFKQAGCDGDNSRVQGSVNRYGKLNWGYNASGCIYVD